MNAFSTPRRAPSARRFPNSLLAGCAVALAAVPVTAQTTWIRPSGSEGSAVRLGTGTPGSAGIPQLRTSRSLLGGYLDLDLQGARPLAPSALVLGLARANIPIWGGRLLPRPDLVLTQRSSSGGLAHWKLQLPKDPSTIGVRLFEQSLVQDPAAIQGMALSDPYGSVVVGPDPAFGAPVKVFDSDQTPGALAAGLLNGGSNADFVTGQFDNDTIKIKYGNGAGAFNSTIVRNSGDAPSDIELGDFDGDGKLDIIATNYGDKLVRIFWGNSTNYGSASQWTVGNNPWQVAVGDLNGDGLDDFVTVNYGTHDLSVRLRDPAGGFKAEVRYASGSDTRDVQLGDFDGDGDLDMVYTYNDAANARLRLRKNNGNGSFGAPTDIQMGSVAGVVFHSIAVGDLDHDGKLDIVAARTPAGLVRVLGKGDGTFNGLDVETSPVVKDFPYRVYLTDVNGDGHRDVLVAHLGAGVVIYRGHGDGNASGPFQYSTPTTSWCRDVRVADFDKDGKMDLVHSGNDGVYVRFGT
ncbi:MAG: VCBS repeat-containing protein [Planctomycetes bacterium]|nr:VCBS repeat-containing protein [Planctomycetota bacterium]